MIRELQNSPFKWVVLFIGTLLIGALAARVFHTIFLRIRKYYGKPRRINLWIPSVVIGLLILPYHLLFSISIIHTLFIILLLTPFIGILRKITGREWRFLYSGAFALILSGIVCVYGVLNWLVIVPHEYVIETDKVDREYTIVYISDVHGPLMPELLFRKYMKDISGTNPDYVLLGGDITDEFTTREKMQKTLSIIGGINSKNGIYYTYGNHDRNKYADKPKYTVDEMNETISSNGIKILKDTVVELDDKVTLIGRDDGGSDGKGRKAMSELMEGVDRTRFVIVAEHEPDAYREVAEQQPDLYLCGHTHAGQMFPIGFYFRTFRHTFNTGRHQYQGLDLIISSGFGTWAMPFRTEFHSEYMVLRIVPAAPAQDAR